MKKVMVFGTFDLLHDGHLYFLQQAKQLGDYLVVSIARDVNVQRIKGALPHHTEKERKQALQNQEFVDRVVLGAIKNPWPNIKKENPSIVALGYDQNPYVCENDISVFEKELAKHGVHAKAVRLSAYKPERFKTSIIKKKHIKQ